jgi:hypothetical protein
MKHEPPPPKRRNRLPEGLAPAALNREASAAYCGVSGTTFDQLIRTRVLPQPRVAPGYPARWLRTELDAALRRLPYRDGSLPKLDDPDADGEIDTWADV